MSHNKTTKVRSVRLKDDDHNWITAKFGDLRKALESLLPKSKKPKKKV